MAPILPGEREPQSVGLVALGQGHDRARHGGREHQRAPRVRRGVEDFLEVLAEAHVEHLVRLVEDYTDQARKVERAAFQVIAQPPRGADDDRRPAAQIAALLARIHPADAGRDSETNAGVEPLQLAADLQRQLARRRHDQRQRPLNQRHIAGFRQQRIGQCKPEGHGLTGTGLRRDDEIAALGLGRDHSSLDGGKGGVAALGEGLGKGGRKDFERHNGHRLFGGESGRWHQIGSRSVECGA